MVVESIEKAKSAWRVAAAAADDDETATKQPNEPKFDMEMLADDHSVARFLKARKGDLNAAHDMMLKALQWRAEFDGGRGVKDVRKDEFTELLKTGQRRFYGHDKHGRPVVYVKVKLHFEPAILKELSYFMVWSMEHYLVEPQKANPDLQMFVVIDLEGIGLANLDLRTLPYMAEVFQNYYPECLGAALVVNAPWIFWASWSLMKTLLDPVMAAKIVFGTPDDLATYVDSSQILPYDQWGVPGDCNLNF